MKTFCILIIIFAVLGRIIAADDGRTEYERGKQYLVEFRSKKSAELKKSAIDYLKIAAKKGSKDALCELGYYYLYDMEAQDIRKAFECVRKSSEMGNSQAKVALADFYLRGRGTKRNRSKAFEIYSELAKENNPQGYAGLGLMYQMGFHVKKNPSKAFGMLKKADELAGGNKNKQTPGKWAGGDSSKSLSTSVYCDLGNYYLLGDLLKVGKPDYQKAQQYYKKSGTYYNYGCALMSISGRGMAKDEKKALEYFKKDGSVNPAIALEYWKKHISKLQSQQD